MKKIMIVLLLCVVYIYPLNAFAKLNIIKNDEDYIIPSEYSFTPKFINGVTTVETSDIYNKADLHNPNLGYRNVYRSHDYHNYWAIYRNVGIWKQHVVDMKITVDDVIDTNPSSKCTQFGNIIADEDVIGLDFRLDVIGLGVSADCREEGTMAFFKVEFFDGTTGEELDDIKTNLTYTDVDEGERILFDNINTKEIYYYTTYGEEHLELISANYNNRYTFFKGNHEWTCTYDGWPGNNECYPITGRVKDCANGDCVGCYKAGMIVTLNEGSFVVGWAGMGIIFSSPSYLRIEDPNSIKTVDKEKVKPGEEIKYTIEQYVPNQSNYQYYQSWELTDKLNEVLETNVDDITITTNDDEDIKDKFDVSLENNVLTITAKKDYLNTDAFYNRTFLIGIPSKVKNGIKGIRTIPNTAVLNVQYNSGSFSEDIPSSDVAITIEGEKEEIVEVPNTAKFTSILIFMVGIVLVGSGAFIIYKATKNKYSA